MNSVFLRSLALLWLGLLASSVDAQQRTIARFFWQDEEDQQLYWGDLQSAGQKWNLKKQSLVGFPSLDPEQQGLVQMVEDEGILVVGVRDQNEGNIGSGWVAVDTGVVEEPHGDHSHWRLKHQPRMLLQQIDDQQGNPAHVYKYGATFALANDRKNGFTLTSAGQIREAKEASQAATFYEGGGGHITLAIVANDVVYSTWIAPAGPDAGRVDVVGIGKQAGKGYSFHCPTGVLHGATTNQNKVFFAPADGVCWVTADRSVSQDPADIVVHPISLGNDSDDKPLRTGAFENLRNYVLFVTGKADAAKLCFLNAAEAEPTLGQLSLPIDPSVSLGTPIPLQTRIGKRFALIFAESADAAEEDQLLIVELDPNLDGDFSDAKLANTLSIGRNRLGPGHQGHHALAVLPTRRYAVFSNPGDGTLSLLSLSDFQVVASLEVGGSPGRIIAVGE